MYTLLFYLKLDLCSSRLHLFDQNIKNILLQFNKNYNNFYYSLK